MSTKIVFFLLNFESTFYRYELFSITEDGWGKLNTTIPSGNQK